MCIVWLLYFEKGRIEIFRDVLMLELQWLYFYVMILVSNVMELGWLCNDVGWLRNEYGMFLG